MLDLVDFADFLEPDDLTALTESFLHNRTNSAELTTIDCDFALEFVAGGPVLCLARLAAVVDLACLSVSIETSRTARTK